MLRTVDDSRGIEGPKKRSPKIRPRGRGRPSDRVYGIQAGMRVRTWLVEAVDGALVTIRCDCGHVFTRYISIVSNQLARARTRNLYCIRTVGGCGLRLASRHLLSLKQTAHKRGIGVDLTVEQVFALRVGKECTYCGGELPAWGGGLDRKDNARGYTVDNVVPCCTDCNTAKATFFSFDEFLAAMRVRTNRVGRGNAWPTRATRPPLRRGSR
jgi:hypothetical protein